MSERDHFDEARVQLALSRYRLNRVFSEPEAAYERAITGSGLSASERDWMRGALGLKLSADR